VEHQEELPFDVGSRGQAATAERAAPMERDSKISRTDGETENTADDHDASST
jgi:hypothetical protein